MNGNFLEFSYETAHTVHDVLIQKKSFIKNKLDEMTDDDGRLSSKYHSWTGLLSELEKLAKRKKDTEDNIARTIEFYIRDNVMGNLYFDRKSPNTKKFEEVYAKLLDDNFIALSSSIRNFDFKTIDDTVLEMRTQFLEQCYDDYADYRKTIQI